MGDGTPRMSMPEATVHKYDLPPRTKYHVRSPRQAGVVHAVAITKRVNEAPNPEFRLCVAPLDRPHDFGAFFLSKVIQELSTNRSDPR